MKPKVTDLLSDRSGGEGEALLDRLLREAVALIRQGEPSALVGATPLAGMLLLLSAAHDDSVAALARAQWGDVVWDESSLVLPGERIRAGRRAERAIMLDPVTATLLWCMWRHGPGDLALPLLGSSLPGKPETTAAIARHLRETIKAHGTTASELRALACQAQREVLPKYLVAAYVAGEVEVRPLRDAAVSILDGYVSRRFGTVEAHAGDPYERERGLPRGPFIAAPPALESLIEEARAVICGGGSSAAIRRGLIAIAVRAAAHLDPGFAALVSDYAEADCTFQLESGPEVRRARRAWRAQAAHDRDSEQSWAFNLFCVIVFVAYRANRPAGERWFESTETAGGIRPRPHTLEAMYDDLIAILRRIGETPLDRWRAEHWRALDALPRERDTRVRLRKYVLQFARFVRERLDLVVASRWSITIPEPRERTFRLPTIGQLEFIAQILGGGPSSPGLPPNVERLLAQDGMRDALALLYAVTLRYGLRIGEALALLMQDVDLLGDTCWVARSKNHLSRTAPGAYVPRSSVDALERRRAQLALQCASGDDQRSPTLIPGTRDAARRASLRYAFGRVLGLIGLTPHDLRHVYATLRIVGAWAWHGDQQGAWPLWVATAGYEPDGVRGTAEALGQTISLQLRSRYDHSGLWLIARAWKERAEPYLSVPISRDRLCILLRCGDATLQELYRSAGERGLVQPGRLTLSLLLLLASILQDRESKGVRRRGW